MASTTVSERASGETGVMPGSAQRSHGAVAVIDEIEAIRNRVQVGERVEIESVGLKDVDRAEDAGKAKSDQEVDTERSENRFGTGLFLGEDAAEDDHDDENVESEA